MSYPGTGNVLIRSVAIAASPDGITTNGLTKRQERQLVGLTTFGSPAHINHGNHLFWDGRCGAIRYPDPHKTTHSQRCVHEEDHFGTLHEDPRGGTWETKH